MATIESLNEQGPDPTVSADEPDVISLHDADGLLETLSSETRRQILLKLSERPSNAAILAEAVDTSVQNVTYHLEKLQTAGLITVIGTHYSTKGREMNLYAPASPTIVIDVFEADSDKTELRERDGSVSARWDGK